MRNIKYTLRFGLVLFICSFFIFSLSGQKLNSLVLKSKILTFSKVRTSFGIDANIGLATLSPTIDESSGGTFVNGSLTVDVHSPLSSIGFLSGLGFSEVEYEFGEKTNDELIGDSISVSTLKIPFYIKIKTGSVGALNRLVMLPGISYNIPISVDLESDFSESFSNRNFNRSYLDYRFLLGYEFFIEKQYSETKDHTSIADSRARYLVYLGVSYSNESIFDDTNPTNDYYKDLLIDLSNSNSINYFIGVNFSFTVRGFDHVVKNLPY